MYFIHAEDVSGHYMGNVLRQKKNLTSCWRKRIGFYEACTSSLRLGRLKNEDGHKRTDDSASARARKSHSRPNGRLKRKMGNMGTHFLSFMILI